MTAPASVRRPPGRPRSPDADRAILDAAVEILAEKGFGGLTASAVVERSGVARATVYRRYPTRDALVLAAAASVKGRPPYALTGDVVADIRTGSRDAQRVFADPTFRSFLPTFVAEAVANPEAARRVTARLSPNHRGVAIEYAATAATAGLRTDIDPEVVPTILLGSMMYRLLSTGEPADEAFTEDVVEVLLAGLRSRT